MANGTQQRREPVPAGETAQQRRARLDTEASMLAVAVADIEAGRVIADGDVDAWLDAWVRGEDMPLPASDPAPSRR